MYAVCGFYPEGNIVKVCIDKVWQHPDWLPLLHFYNGLAYLHEEAGIKQFDKVGIPFQDFMVYGMGKFFGIFFSASCMWRDFFNCISSSVEEGFNLLVFDLLIFNCLPF